MLYQSNTGLSAILGIGALEIWGNPVWILFKLCIYLYFISQVQDYYIQMANLSSGCNLNSNNNNNNNKMSYIYKQPQINTKNKRTSSFSTNELTNETYNNNNNNDQQQLLLLNCNNQNINVNNSNNNNNCIVISPAMSTNSAISPQNLNSSNSNSTTNLSNVPNIPTRFVDRRVSTSIMQSDPYKFNVNYSEAGQRLAKKAQEQLKCVEKSKEDLIDNQQQQQQQQTISQSINNSKNNNNNKKDYVYSLNDVNNGEDWQNVSKFIS